MKVDQEEIQSKLEEFNLDLINTQKLTEWIYHEVNEINHPSEKSFGGHLVKITQGNKPVVMVIEPSGEVVARITVQPVIGNVKSHSVA